jgi:hypothetical protein
MSGTFLKNPFKSRGAEIKKASPNLAVTRTATADGTTTAVISPNDEIVNVAASNADHWVTLPALSAVELGKTILLVVGAQGCEVRAATPASEYINEVKGTNKELAMTALYTYMFIKTASDKWSCIISSGTAD